jgi:hypothetical protein
MGIIWNLLTQMFGGAVEKAVIESLSTDYRDDPVYKRNVQKLIEHHRQFEQKK